jgi:hypothetical protein
MENLFPRGCAGGCGAALEGAQGHDLEYGKVADAMGWSLATRTDGPADAFCPNCSEQRRLPKDARGSSGGVVGRQGSLAVFVNGSLVSVVPLETHVTSIRFDLSVVRFEPTPDGEKTTAIPKT